MLSVYYGRDIARQSNGRQHVCLLHILSSARKDGDATLLVGVLKNVGHVCFDRTLDAETGLFEFFVPSDQKELFLAIMNDFEKMGSVSDLAELPNRLLDPAQQV